MAALDFIRMGTDPARGRLTRCIRESEVGWLFYSPTGAAYHLFAEEADRLAADGNAAIDRFTDHAILSRRLYRYMIVFGFVFLAADIFLLDLGSPGIDGMTLGASIFAGIITSAIVLAMFHPFLAMIYRGIAFMLWQAKIARGLNRKGRGGVPKAIAKKHLRYNLFRLISMSALILIVFRLTLFFFLPISFAKANFGWVDLAAAGVFFWSAIPAYLLDKQHERRKWLD